MNKLKAVQNNAARLVTKEEKSDHVTPLLKYLHWLSIRQGVESKILLLTFNAFLGHAPVYACDMLEL